MLRETQPADVATPRTPSGRLPRASSHGPERLGYLSEAQLAERWGRSVNTLVGWRTRQQAGRQLIPVRQLDGAWYYHFTTINGVEADASFDWVRPAKLRGVELPPLTVLAQEERMRATAVAPAITNIQIVRGTEQPELPLDPPAQVRARAFRSVDITFVGLYLWRVAVAEDGTAWVSYRLVDLAAGEWSPWEAVTPLPTVEEVR